jgi:hypothetical protein
MEEKKPIEYVGYVIDRGIPFDGVQKAVDFYDGVGILDLEVIASTAPYWFDRNTAGAIVGIHWNAMPMQVFVDYWVAGGAKETPICEKEAQEIKTALVAKTPIDSKYLKAVVDTRKVAGGREGRGSGSGETAENEAPTPVKGRGRR